MPDIANLKKMYCLHDKIEKRKIEIDKLDKEIMKEKQTIDNIFSRKFKVRGIHAKVEEYSIKENRITIVTTPPDSGVDELILTFEEFAEQVEFLR